MSAICTLEQEAHVHTDSIFTVASAAAWGGNFHFDNIDIASDVADFYLTGGLKSLGLCSSLGYRFPVHTKRAIRIWRAVMVLVGLDEQRVVQS